jgi:hypothetical protein
MLLKKVILCKKSEKNLYVDIKNGNTDYSSDKMLQTKDKSKKRFFEANILGGPKIFSFFLFNFLGEHFVTKAGTYFLTIISISISISISYDQLFTIWTHKPFSWKKNPHILRKWLF